MATTQRRAYGSCLSSLVFLLLAPGCTSGAAGPELSAAGGTTAVSGAAGEAGSTSSAAGAQCTSAEVNRVGFRVLTRLNRAEYDNTARDLLGDTAHVPRNALPADFGDGAFDNNADALTIDPSLGQQLSQVAETLAENALAAGSPGRKLLLICEATDHACAERVLSQFASRAWRRPLRPGELDRLLALYDSARSAAFSFDQGLQTAIQGTLLSPNFLFRPEIDAVADSPEVNAVAPYELASRLSYFLWSSMPDDALLASAASGDLLTGAGLQTQFARMWNHPNAEAFFQRFPGQWLHTLDVSVAKQPAAEVFPAFNATLKDAMEGETLRFMRELVTSDRDFLDLLDADFTYLNAPLAQFYGIAGQFDSEFIRVDLTGNAQRGGILTQASFLTLTSPPERTSPVMRGQWVLARLLDAPPPPPPDNIPNLDSEVSATPQTMRQKMLAHRTNPSCAACHAAMDPVGFGLENFDGIGQWRTTEKGLAIDASGELGLGQGFNGARELQSLLKSDPRVPRAVVKYLLSYALGRQVGDADRCLVDNVTTAFQSADKNRMKALVARVTALPAFLMRRGAP